MKRDGLPAVWETLRLVGGGMLDLIYPARCLVCERHGLPALCEECVSRFVPMPEPACAVCGHPVEEASPCRLCAEARKQGGWGFDSARAAAVYQGPLRRAVHILKYRHGEELGDLLGSYLANRLVVDGLLTAAVDLVVPVPIHAARRRDRGYNQAALLAAPVAAMLGAALDESAVRKTRRTAAQVRLSPSARRRNLDGAFAADPARVRGRRILLIDDVFTTGSTVSACAAALREAGAAAVHVAALASGG